MGYLAAKILIHVLPQASTFIKPDICWTSAAVLSLTAMRIIELGGRGQIHWAALAALGIVNATLGSLGIGLLLGVPLKVTAITTLFPLLPLSLWIGGISYYEIYHAPGLAMVPDLL